MTSSTSYSNEPKNPQVKDTLYEAPLRASHHQDHESGSLHKATRHSSSWKSESTRQILSTRLQELNPENDNDSNPLTMVQKVSSHSEVDVEYSPFQDLDPKKMTKIRGHAG